MSLEGSVKFNKWISKYKPPILVPKISKPILTAIGFNLRKNNNKTGYCILYWEGKKLEVISLGPQIPVDDGSNGEIRPFVINLESFNKILKLNKAKLEDIEEKLLDDLNNNKIAIEVFIYEEDSKLNKWYLDHINSKRLTIITLALTTLLLSSTDPNFSYLSLLSDYYPDKIVDMFTKYDDVVILNDIKFNAQKLYPLTIQEDYNNNNHLNLGAWKDFIIAYAMSTIHEYMIIPSVMISGRTRWQFRASKEIFNSKYINNKYKESERLERTETESDYYETNFKIMADVVLCYGIDFTHINQEPELDICNLFELLYTMWYAHSELRFIHTQLQSSIICKPYSSNSEDISSCNVYIVGPDGEKDTYVFDKPTNTCHIFNYKSAIIMTNSILVQNERIAYDNSQLYYMINVINKYIEIELSPSDIRNSLRSKDYWYDIFVVLCIGDYIDICEYVLSQKIDSVTKDFCTKIRDLSVKSLISGLNNIINKMERPESTFHIVWDTIKDLYQDYQYIKTVTKNKAINVRYIYDELFNRFPKKDYLIK